MINDYFTNIFCINLDRRTDRWDVCQEQFKKFDIHGVTRFPGYPAADPVAGCYASHRDILALAAWHQWPSVLILEDDFKILHEDFSQRICAAMEELPKEWDMLYLGGNYDGMQAQPISPRIARCRRMFTTSSYAIKGSYARNIIPELGSGPIDVAFSRFGYTGNHYIVQPRLVSQMAGYSDIEKTVVDYYGVLTDVS